MTVTAHKVEPRGRRNITLRESHRTALLVCGLILLPFLIFAPETIGQQVFYYHDLQYYFLPYHKLVADVLHQGSLPLWNPYAFGGIPLLGDGQTAIFYPPSWFFLIMPPTLALNYDVLAQFSIAGASMFVFARSLSMARPASALAALTYMFNGYLVARVVHLSILSGAALIPLIFWSADRFRARPTGGRFAVAALAVALQVFTGHPQVPLYTALALGLYVLIQDLLGSAQVSPGRVVRTLLGLAAIDLAGCSLAALQLLPWIDFARLSPRAANATLDFIAFHSLVGVDWLLLIMPYLYGGVRTGLFNPHPSYIGTEIYLWERTGYPGLLPLALAALALLAVGQRGQRRARRHPRVWALAGVLLLGLLIAGSGTSPVGRMLYLMPIVGKLRAYSRAIVLASFAIAALAAIGLQTLIDLTEDGHVPAWLRRRIVLVAGMLALVFIFALAVLPRLIDRSTPYDHRQRLVANLSIIRPNAWVPLLLAGCTVVLLIHWSRAAVPRFPAWALGLATADLLLFAMTFNPTIAPSALEEVPPSVAFLQRDRSLYRTATFLQRDTLDPGTARAQLALSWGLAFGIPSINGFNSLQPRRYTDLLFGPIVDDVSYGLLDDGALLQPDSHILDMLQTKYVLVQPGVPVSPGPGYKQVFKDSTVTIYLNLHVYPRAYFVSQLHVVRTGAAAFAALQSHTFDPRIQAVVETGPDPALTPDLLGSTSGAEARERQIAPDHLQVGVSTPAERFLVLSEMYMPGWSATIDGYPAKIYRTNYLFRGLVVPAGVHTVDLVYRPFSVIAGAVASALAAILLALMPAAGLLCRKRRRSWLHRARVTRPEPSAQSAP